MLHQRAVRTIVSRASASIARVALALATSMIAAGCGDPGGPTATLSGVVMATTGAPIKGALVTAGAETATTDAEGRFEIKNLPVGSVTITTTAPLFDARSDNVSLAAGVNAHDVVLVPQPTATLSGIVTAAIGGAIQGASVTISGITATTGADGRFEIQKLPIGSATIAASASGYDVRTESVSLIEGPNTHNMVLTKAGEWGQRAALLQPNSEFALAESNGKLYVLGGYPPSRVTVRTVQIYDIASNSWQFGPQLPQPNNHGMAAAVNGKIYLIGGQLTADQEGYVETVYELDPAVGVWVTKAPMPTARSGGVAVVLDGKIYVAGGRVPRGNDFAVYDPAADRWDVLPDLPTQRNHITGAAINGRIHIVGGRLGNGLSPLKTDVNEVFDPATGTWTTAAPMLRGRSGMNGVMARGCFHVWGGEAPTGMTPDHDYYDPRNDRWVSLPNMPIPIHGVVGSAFVNGLIWVTGGGTQIGGSFGSLLNQTYRPEVSCE